MVAVAMARRADVNFARQDSIVQDEDPFPGHFDVVAHYHAVALVEAPGQRTVEFVFNVDGKRLPRPQGQAVGIARHCASHCLLYLVGRQRQQIADPDLVGEYGCGRQHLHARNDHTVVILAHDLQARNRQILLLIKGRITRRLGRQHGISRIGVFFPHTVVVPRHVLRQKLGSRQRRPRGSWPCRRQN